MTYIVNDNCINCKYTDCVEVCPVDCFYEGENMLVIHPDECIDCGVCEPECPPEAILPDSEPDAEKWLELNREMSEIWPNILGRKLTPCQMLKKCRTRKENMKNIFLTRPVLAVRPTSTMLRFYCQLLADCFLPQNQL